MFRQEIDSPYAWFRLTLSVVMSTISGVGLWSVVVALPAIQADFHADRAEASLPFTLATIGIGIGSVLMGKLVDRAGLIPPVLLGAAALTIGYILAAFATSLTQLAIIYGIIGMLGSAATFVPLISDISFWFQKRRGIAVALVASGNSLSGAVWPPVIEWSISAHGWRTTHLLIGVFCGIALPLMGVMLRSRPPKRAPNAIPFVAVDRRIHLRPRTLQILLAVASLASCVAMGMPQGHIVAYASDLGYGAASGASMMSLIFAFSVVSRIGSGFLADRVGGLLTLLIGSIAQLAALSLYLLMNSLTALYIISALFGLCQGGIVPCYAIMVRENYPPQQTGTRVGIVLMMTLLGMGLGSWMSGAIFDRTGGYTAAFANGVAFSALNVLITLALLMRTALSARRSATAPREGSATG